MLAPGHFADAAPASGLATGVRTRGLAARGLRHRQRARSGDLHVIEAARLNSLDPYADLANLLDRMREHPINCTTDAAAVEPAASAATGSGRPIATGGHGRTLTQQGRFLRLQRRQPFEVVALGPKPALEEAVKDHSAL